MSSRLFRLLLLVGCMFAFSGIGSAAEGKLMHCFYFTPIEEASEADWDAFHKATDELPGRIPGLLNVWHGDLRRDFTYVRKRGDEVSETVRKHGVCMEFEDEQALEAYAPHEAHRAWEDVYFKVRQPGTNTFDILAK